ncbi:ubiquinol oxidase subunit I [Burkholderia pseudomallei]|uniref:Uncharacterized protein n=2 Tax=Burkholderia pseudomallei TaxID=28450 RepID=A0A0H3HL13_BURP2|nr:MULTISPECIES: hypothetical protein [Burkholderia]EIF68001.1 hypothetical protein BP1258A_0795 [Burkholderia pseudomallei 1258a]ABN85281.1 conserved hypothetical protein [Burkholderia pseudomallei 668]ABN91238.1 hypothetical protein BURPS1106A_2757 [Burkholderia pseudomallei 1106a]ACQ96990.1 conserved hypothetical protein [Burkholderia pseudomallei MSHR346]AFI65610.1 hypothetical protein BP1026B_I0958 [Burkholderia pseudomallei 1026b]
MGPDIRSGLVSSARPPRSGGMSRAPRPTVAPSIERHATEAQSHRAGAHEHWTRLASRIKIHNKCILTGEPM